MLSLRGIYKDGKITMLNPTSKEFPENSEVLLTFLPPLNEDEVEDNFDGSNGSRLKEGTEDYFQSIRKHERIKAQGNITIIAEQERKSFLLNDYSPGGLSFISETKLNVGQIISAGISDPSNPDSVLMELEMEVRGVIQIDETGFRTGCMFVEQIDEDLWHGLLQFFS